MKKDIKYFANELIKVSPYFVKFIDIKYTFDDACELIEFAHKNGSIARPIFGGEYFEINDPVFKMLEDVGIN